MPASKKTLSQIEVVIFKWQEKFSVSDAALKELFSKLATETQGNSSYNKTVKDLYDMMVGK